MKHSFYLFLAIMFMSIFNSCAQNSNDYLIANNQEAADIFIDSDTDPLIVWAVNELAKDIEDITGTKPEIIQSNQIEKEGIYIGMISDELFKSTTQEGLTGKWENFSIKKENDNLLVIGSDVRGTVYAIFDIAEKLGVSPWKWWADVNSLKKESLTLELLESEITQSPSVQYRGVFLNDEDWGLQPWAAKTFEPETNDMGPKTYEKIFQLLLRLKANTIWPAMHPSTKGFFTIDGNKEMAQKYHIVIGSSHAEPMLRNNVDEWDHEVYGDYNYFTNSKQVNKYWQDRLDEVSSTNNHTIMTLGMRGVHDSKMEGAKSLEESVKMIDGIISTQRQMLSNTFKKPLIEIPQTFILYKEVLELHDNGLKVPDDVTLMWTDDNYGYIRRLSNEEEQKRIGGSGVYYHLSYWGRPHDYLWLSTTQPGLIWYEMTRAYENGAKKMWIANVGDIKPAEYNIELFLDMAWDVGAIKSDEINQHLENWISREFTPTVVDELSIVFKEYHRLAFLRKPEYMGWSQTEPTTQVKRSEFSKEETLRRLNAYKQLVEKVDNLAQFVPKERKDAWFQLVEYPIKGAAFMNYKFLYWNLAASTNKKEEQVKFTQLSAEAYQKINQLTSFYNNDMTHGKWKHMMSMNPRNLPVFDSVKIDLPSPIVETKTHNKRIYIQANESIENKGVNNYEWKSINGLGYSNNAMTLFPLKHSYFKNEKPSLTYTFEADNLGDYELEIRLIPIHANNFDHEIEVQIDSNKLQSFSINTKGRSNTWKENVLRNSAIVKVPISILKKGKHTITISVNQTGIVLDQLTVYPEKMGSSYEIPNFKIKK
ncbi:glycosyl hydrolase 115 family protein [Mariniflexile litorale]|uniref:Glycosyl hydrolase 115 family protein n=1 Tax=Mariniflexile litorale TaxID=3045158 RepID=A0AAU7EKR2_9FLAO|nr:glycosyl hydrolase 115 family protein [Mariniflexile sp. KMM 9835]MDQ8210646.1 glycosyl hydrolase 115 family protein [Mariniflexile sp. KMM 9835]